MGIEYTLQFDYPDPAAVVDGLRPLPFARELPPPSVGFELRAAGSDAAMPDATVQVEPYGLYFCDHGGAGRDLLGRVVACLVGRFGAVTISELE
jgi:hypothetical protein